MDSTEKNKLYASKYTHKRGGMIAMEITGAELFVKALKAESVTTLFAYPGVVVVDLPKDIQRAYGGDRY